MAKIIIAFAEEEQRARIAEALEKSGIRVSRRCATGAEALRAMNQLQDGVLVCAARLPDRTADELADDLGELALMLVVGKPEALALCEARRSFQLPLPASRGELATFAVRIIFRQNASWQGSVVWLEGEREESFRSALELVLLMDSALRGGGEEAAP